MPPENDARATPSSAPQGVEDALREAVSLHRTGRLHEAIERYEAAHACDPDNPQALDGIGTVYAQLGDLPNAIAWIARAVAAAPEHVQGFRNLGILLREQHRFDESVAAFERALALDPVSAETLNELGMTHRRSGALRHAVDAYRRALAISPDYTLAHANLGNALQDLDCIEEACQSYERATGLDSGIASVHRAHGNALQRLRKLERAIDSYRRAVALQPDYARASSDLGSALMEHGDVEEGIGYLRRAVELDPGGSTVHANLGMALHERGDLKDALACYDASLEREPGNSHALAYKTIVLRDLGEQAALDYLLDFDRLVRAIHPSPPPGHDSIEAVNDALASFARQHPTLQGASDRRPGISGELLAEGEAPARALESMIRECLRTYLDELPRDDGHPFLARRPRDFRIIGWANVLRHAADIHIHPQAWLSGTYYVSLGDLGSDNGDESGWLEIGRPDPRLDRGCDSHIKRYRPSEGLMLLFPSYCWHGILPFESPVPRISYAFDIVPIQ